MRSPTVEIMFRRSEDTVEDTPRRQISGFVIGLVAAILVGIVLFFALAVSP